MPARKLNPKQALFVAHYLGKANFCAAEAARLAGYSERSAKELGRRLLDHPLVQAEIEAWRAAVKSEGIACQTRRIAAQNSRWLGLQAVINARAEEHRDVPGGATGLLVRQAKLVKVYESSEDAPPDEAEVPAASGEEALAPTKQSYLVYEYSVDTGLLKELRDLEVQVAKELGQFVERSEVKVADFEGMSDAELARIVRDAAAEPAVAAGGDGGEGAGA